MSANKLSHFLNVFLQKPASSIPKGTLWAVYFDDIKGKILPAVNLAYQTEPYAEWWNTEASASVLLTDEYAAKAGISCIFCQAIDVPGEGSNPVAEGNIKYNSYIRSYVGAGRNDFPVMRMSFLETNISFADSVLRGWALATAKYGMIARNEPGNNKNYRTNAYCFKYVATPQGLQVKATISFVDLCCINVDSLELNHDLVTGATKRNAQFVYQSYSYDAVKDVPSDLLNNQISQ